MINIPSVAKGFLQEWKAHKAELSVIAQVKLTIKISVYLRNFLFEHIIFKPFPGNGFIFTVSYH